MEAEVCLVGYEAFIGLRNAVPVPVVITLQVKCCLVGSGVLQAMFKL